MWEFQTAVPDLPIPGVSRNTYCFRNCKTRLFSGSDPKKLPWNHNSAQDHSWYPIFTHHLKPCLIPPPHLAGWYILVRFNPQISWWGWLLTILGKERKSALQTSRWYWMIGKRWGWGSEVRCKKALEITWAGLHLYHHHGGPGACGELVWGRSRAFVRFQHGSIH